MIVGGSRSHSRPTTERPIPYQSPRKRQGTARLATGRSVKEVERPSEFCYTPEHGFRGRSFGARRKVARPRDVVVIAEPIHRRAAAALLARINTLFACRVTIGLDGFVDE